MKGPMPTPEQTGRLIRALEDAAESESKKPTGHIGSHMEVQDVIEMIEKYPQLVAYSAETLAAIDRAQMLSSGSDYLRMLVAVQAFATLAKEILELDDERPVK